MRRSTRSVILACAVLGAVTACASGESDPLSPRTRDTGTPPSDAAPLDAGGGGDAGPPPPPPADAGPGCECSPGETSLGAACGMCGFEGRECGPDCRWRTVGCTEEGDCVAGSTQTGTESCGSCGEGTRTVARACSGACTWGPWSATGSCSVTSECAPGATDTDTRACATTGSESRTRTCDAGSCRWGAWSAWSGCPVSSCPDGTCGAGESCSSCVDCQAGHGTGTVGNNGDPCPGVPAEQWRCVTIGSFGVPGSQVCRGGSWVTFHLNPTNCSACVCSYSGACAAP